MYQQLHSVTNIPNCKGLFHFAPLTRAKEYKITKKSYFLLIFHFRNQPLYLQFIQKIINVDWLREPCLESSTLFNNWLYRNKTLWHFSCETIHLRLPDNDDICFYLNKHRMNHVFFYENVCENLKFIAQ
jgi:hypothetical protein